jgi:hypothetical protein
MVVALPMPAPEISAAAMIAAISKSCRCSGRGATPITAIGNAT